MRVWIPYISGGSGSDVSTEYLAHGLKLKGHEVYLQKFQHNFQYAPFTLIRVAPPARTDLIIANSWNAFAFRREGIKLIAVERLFPLAQIYRPYRSFAQSIFYEAMVRQFLRWSYRAADAVVALSLACAEQIRDTFPWAKPTVILNGVDTEFFSPHYSARPLLTNRRIRLLFVGNLTRRKGADLLVPILSQLGNRYELRYASGLRTAHELAAHSRAKSLGKLTLEQVRDAYRNSDILIFPSRHESLSRVVLEAQSCGLPAVVSDLSSLPECVNDKVTGCVCKVDNVTAYVDAIRSITETDTILAAYRRGARRLALERFSLDRMVAEYVSLGERLTKSK